jgi:hypothetical protein
MRKYKLNSVFKAVGQPTVTYVSRGHLKLENGVRRAIMMPNAVASITGPSKSGKTVLCREIMKEREFVWIEGGQLNPITKLWSKLASALQKPSALEETDATDTSLTTSIDVEAKAKIPLIAEGSGNLGGKLSRVRSVMKTKRATIDLQDECLAHMTDNEIALVIDDFHYIDRLQQAELVRNLRGAMFNGLKVILISVPHHAYAAQIAENELTGRLVHVEVPEWAHDDLAEIASRGAAALNMQMPSKLIKRFAEEALGSPNIMQQFCWDLCFTHDILETKGAKKRISSKFDPEIIFAKLADDTGLPIYSRLAHGPQTRTPRIGRELINGAEVDIYQAILLAIAATGPKKILTYNEIRDSLSSILGDKVPQKIEVSNALSHLSKISEGISPSNRPIEWMGDQLQLVLADPMFRFFMRWKVRKSL